MQYLIGEQAKKICQKILDKGCGDSFKWGTPFVKGYFQENGHWTAFDNRTADLWIESFDTEAKAISWLKDEFEVNEEN